MPVESNLSRNLLDEQRWIRLLSEPLAFARPALFLDRDGVMIEERGYLSDPAGVALIPGCSALVRQANHHGLPVVVVSNQSGIGRGYFGWAEHDRVERRLVELLALEDAAVDALFANSATPDHDHCWRKPSTGMLFAAAHALNLDLARSGIIGDKASDLEAGRKAGLCFGMHVLTGHGLSEDFAASEHATATFKVAKSHSVANVRIAKMGNGAFSFETDLQV